MPRKYRPNRFVFVVRPTAIVAAAGVLLVLAATAFAPVVDLGAATGFGAGVALWVLLVGFRFLQRSVVFGKTRYRVFDDRIVMETGGLLSERSVDLQFSNVTRADLKLPFLEHRFYETGHVTVQAAGSAAAEIVFQSVDEPHDVYDAISDALRHNGFSLARERKIQEERPGFVGSLYELGAPIVTTGFALLFVIPDMLQMVLEVAQVADVEQLVELFTSGGLAERAAEVSVAAIVSGVLLMLGMGGAALLFIVLRWLDILKRVYTLHDDVIDYTDGFLTKRRSFIPVENLTDVEIEEKLAQRVLSISTIKVSCQGSGVDIRLAAMPNGQQFKANLETLIDQSAPPTRAPRPERAGVQSSAEAPEAPREKLPRVEGTYDWKRGLVRPVVFGIVVGLFVVIGVVVVAAVAPDGETVLGGLGGGFVAVFIVASIIIPQVVKVGFQAYALNYAVDDRKVTHTYSLLSRKQTEFTVDKISAVTIKRSPVDRWFGTAKVTFRSIGSAQTISFENLKNADAVIDAVLTRMNIDASVVERTAEPRYTPGGQVRSVDRWTVVSLVLFVGSIVGTFFVGPAGLALTAAALVGIVSRSVYLKLFCDRAVLDTGPTWLRFSFGVLIRSRVFIPRHQVRGSDATQYVGETRGALKIRSGGGASAWLGYLDDVWELQDTLDGWLYREQTGEVFDTAEVTTRAPAVFNAVVHNTIRSIVIVIGAPFLIFTIPWTVVATKRIEYRLEGSRVTRLSGVFRRRRDTILLPRIDHLTTSRGVLNRMNDTGSIGVVTLGSGGTDMSVRDVRDHQGFYETIESMTKRQLTGG